MQQIKTSRWFYYLNHIIEIKYVGDNPTEYQKVFWKFIIDNFSREDVEKMSEEVLRRLTL